MHAYRAVQLGRSGMYAEDSEHIPDYDEAGPITDVGILICTCLDIATENVNLEYRIIIEKFCDDMLQTC